LDGVTSVHRSAVFASFGFLLVSQEEFRGRGSLLELGSNGLLVQFLGFLNLPAFFPRMTWLRMRLRVSGSGLVGDVLMIKTSRSPAAVNLSPDHHFWGVY